MPSPATNVFTLTPPRRPTLADVGGGAKLNDTAFPPDPVTMLTAEDVNQFSQLHTSLASVTPLAVFVADYLSASNTFAAISTAKFASVNPNMVASDITIDSSVGGQVTFTYPANKLPISFIPPLVNAVYDPANSTSSTVQYVQRLSNGCTVRFFGSGQTSLLIVLF